MNFKKIKTCVFGIQASGKTTFVKHIYRQFKCPIVFEVNKDDGWRSLPQLYVWECKDRINVRDECDKFLTQCHKWAMQGKIDAIIIDEADSVFANNWDISPVMLDFVLNHRHIGESGKEGIALIFITRRPQDIPTKIVESSHNLVIFKLEGANAIQRFKEIHPALPAMIDKLDYERKNWIHKEIGKNPVLMKPLDISKK